MVIISVMYRALRILLAFFVASSLWLLLDSQQVAYAAVGDNCVIQPGNVAGTRDWKGTCIKNDGATYTPVDGSSGINNSTKGTCGELNADNKTLSSSGLVKWLCTQSNSDPNRNAINVLVETTSNYIVGLGSVVLLLMMALAMVQITVAGSSPEALKAGRKRLVLVVTSFALLLTGRVVLDLIGVTGSRFLGVDVQDFSRTTIPAIIRAIKDYLLFAGGSLGVGIIIFAGIKMMTSAGNPQAVQASRKLIMYAVIGLLGLASITLIYNIIQKVLTG